MAVSEDMIGRNKQAAVVEHPMERTTATVCVWRCDQREVSNCCLHSSQGPEPIQIQTPPQIQPMIPSIHLMIPRLISVPIFISPFQSQSQIITPFHQICTCASKLSLYSSGRALQIQPMIPS
eukprot:117716_1